MSDFLQKKHNLIILAGILILGFFLRWHQAATFPPAGETVDEYAWTWLGSSLLSGEPPTSWTRFGHYQNCQVAQLGSDQFKLCQPDFDNPPLFSLIPGLIANIAGYEVGELPSIKVIRFPMLLIGTVNIFLVYQLAKRWWGHTEAWLASLLFATIPSIVISSRMVLAENLLITLVLVAGLALHRYQKHQDKRSLWLLLAVSLASPLVKLTGLFIPVALIGLTWNSSKKLRNHLIAGVLSAGIIWLGYGWWYGWNEFIAAHVAQSGRPTGFITIFTLFLRPTVLDKPVFDGWMLLGWFALFGNLIYSQSKSTAKRTISFLFLAWLGFFLFTTGETTFHGWYRYPMFPLMALLIARLLSKLKSFIPLVIVSILAATNLHFLLQQSDPSFNRLLYRSLLVIVFGLVSLEVIQNKKLLVYKTVKTIALSLLILINCVTILQIDAESIHLDVVKYFKLVPLNE